MVISSDFQSEEGRFDPDTGYMAEQEEIWKLVETAPAGEPCGHFEEVDVALGGPLLGVDYRTGIKQVRHSVADKTRLYDVTIKFLNGATEVVTDAVLINRTGNILEIGHGSDSSVAVNLANVQFVSILAHADRTRVAPGTDEIRECGNLGPRIGDEVARCGVVNGHSDEVRHFDRRHGVEW